MNNNYLVELHVESSEFSFDSLRLVSAESEERAKIAAINSLTGNALEWGEGSAFEPATQNNYIFEKVTVVPDEDLQVLEKYLGNRAVIFDAEDEADLSPR